MGRPKKVVSIEPLEINEPEEQPIKPLEKTEVSDEEVDTFEEVFETPAKKPRKKMNLTDEERERRRIRLRLNNQKYLEEKKLKKLQAKYEEEEEKKRVHEELQNIKDDLVIKKAKKVIDKKIKVSKKLQRALELSDDDEPVKKVEPVKIEPIEFPVKKQRKPRIQREVISNTYTHEPIINFL
jgi:hypothetical protein